VIRGFHNARKRVMKTILLGAVNVALILASLLAARADEPPSVATDAQDKSVSAELDKTKQQLAPAYLLAYKFVVGDEFRTKVVHLVTVETKINGTENSDSSRSVSNRLWRIKQIDGSGNIVFENIVESVDMWTKSTGRAEVRFNSQTDKSPPQEYLLVAESMGKVLSVVTMDPHGRIIARDDKQKQFNPGIGDLTIPFPAQPVKAGATWSIPDEVRVKLDDGTIKKISTRQRYKLDKVENGVATISVATQVLTPVNDPKVQSQLVQRLQEGTIKFDVEAGRLIHKQMDLDQAVFGFSGPDSHMQYLARFTEEPTIPDATAAKAGVEKR
jgi:hypothetical protein